jgi:hypothetical protein
MPNNANNKWTAEHDVRFKSMIEANTSIHLVAAKLKRSIPGVKARASALKISIKRIWLNAKI